MRWLRLSRSGGQNRPVSCLEIGYELPDFRGRVRERVQKGFNRSPTKGDTPTIINESADPGACGGDLGVFCYKRVPGASRLLVFARGWCQGQLYEPELLGACPPLLPPSILVKQCSGEEGSLGNFLEASGRSLHQNIVSQELG